MYTPLSPTFKNVLVKLGNVGANLFFLILLQNIDCGYSCTHNVCFEQKLEKYLFFSDKIFQFLLLEKISVYCMGKFVVMHVFSMWIKANLSLNSEIGIGLSTS